MCSDHNIFATLSQESVSSEIIIATIVISECARAAHAPSEKAGLVWENDLGDGPDAIAPKFACAT